MNEESLVRIMKSLTRWDWPKTTEEIQFMCNISPANWYAYMGLMETYEIKYIKAGQRYVAIEGGYI